jgi:hypothetical protein
MWEPRENVGASTFTNLWASTACYRHSSTFLLSSCLLICSILALVNNPMHPLRKSFWALWRLQWFRLAFKIFLFLSPPYYVPDTFQPSPLNFVSISKVLHSSLTSWLVLIPRPLVLFPAHAHPPELSNMNLSLLVGLRFVVSSSPTTYVGVLISLWLFLFAAQPNEFFLVWLKKLEQRSHKCMELRGEYVE